MAATRNQPISWCVVLNFPTKEKKSGGKDIHFYGQYVNHDVQWIEILPKSTRIPKN